MSLTSEAVPFVGMDAPVCDITTADVEGYLNGLRSKDGKHKAAVKTFNGYRADLNVFCVWCMEQTDANEQGQKLRWMLENPVAAIKKRTPWSVMCRRR